MKLIFENWRNFLDEERKAQELLKEETSCPPNHVALPDGTCFRDPLHVPAPDSMRAGPEIRSGKGKPFDSRAAAEKTKAALTRDKMKRAHHRMSGGPQTPEADEVARVVASMGDPTGVLSYPDVKYAYMEYQNNPSKASMGWLFIAVIAAIPIAGYAAKPFKLAKLTKTVNKADAAFTAAVKAKKPGALQAQEMMAARSGRAKGGTQVASKTAAASGQVSKSFPGLNPMYSGKTGRPTGVFVDDMGRSFVSLIDETGKTATFMYSSGTSYLIKHPTSGKMVASPRSWTPVGAAKPGGRIKKYIPVNSPRAGSTSDIPDPRFGKGDQDLYDRLIDVDVDLDADLVRKFGDDWPREIWKNPRIEAAVETALETGGKFQYLKNKPGALNPFVGKYPAPDSVFGRLGKKLERIAPNGTPEELVDYFGDVVRGVDYNVWRAGQI